MKYDLKVQACWANGMDMVTLVVQDVDGKPLPNQAIIEALREYADFLEEEDAQLKQ